jgi:quercetin dioxygenase-like cupin family protein
MSIVGTDPDSRWGLLVDPAGDGPRVDSLGIITQRFAPGGGTTLHAHDVDEALTVLDGEADARLGEERRRVGPGAVVFIPAGTPHSIHAAGDGPLSIHAVFPAQAIEIVTLVPGDPATVGRRSRLDLRTGGFVSAD